MTEHKLQEGKQINKKPSPNSFVGKHSNMQLISQVIYKTDQQKIKDDQVVTLKNNTMP